MSLLPQHAEYTDIMANTTKTTAEAESLPSPSVSAAAIAEDTQKVVTAQEVAKDDTSFQDTAPPVGAALFGTADEEEKHVQTVAERRAKYSGTDKLPASIVKGDVIASASLSGHSPQLSITPVGWVGQTNLVFGLYEIDDLISALTELRKAIK